MGCTYGPGAVSGVWEGAVPSAWQQGAAGAAGPELMSFDRSRGTAGAGLFGAEVPWRGHCWHPGAAQLLWERGCGMSPACLLPWRVQLWQPGNGRNGNMRLLGHKQHDVMGCCDVTMLSLLWGAFGV